MAVVIRYAGDAELLTTAGGGFLAAVHLERQEDDVLAVADWTADKAEALAFGDFRAAFETWRQVSPLWPVRSDGKPNRPLTVFSVAFEEA